MQYFHEEMSQDLFINQKQTISRGSIFFVCADMFVQFYSTKKLLFTGTWVCEPVGMP